MLAEEPVERPQRAVLLDRLVGVAGEDVARVRVADGQRVGAGVRPPVDAVAGPELAFVVSGPHLAGRVGHERTGTGVGREASAPPRLDEPVPLEDRSHSRGRWQRRVGIPLGDPREELARPPRRVLAPGLDDERLDLGRSLGVLSMPDAGLVVECIDASSAKPGEPLVAGLTADAESLAQLGHGVEALGVEGDEACALGHGSGVGPRHGGKRLCRGERICHPCARSGVLPMCPVHTLGAANSPLHADEEVTVLALIRRRCILPLLLVAVP